MSFQITVFRVPQSNCLMLPLNHCRVARHRPLSTWFQAERMEVVPFLCGITTQLSEVYMGLDRCSMVVNSSQELSEY